MQSTTPPSRGYWVKTSDSGEVVLTPFVAFARLQPAPATNALAGLNTLKISDQDGSAQTLIYGEMIAELGSLDSYELPPSPPSGVFDARFETQRSVAFVDRSATERIPIRISASTYPGRIAGTVRELGFTASLRVGKESFELTSNGSAIVASPGEVVELFLSQSPAIPHAYSLNQNYPNPFNPTTTISYGLPQNSQVRLSIFNLLGQEVARLVDEVKPAGYYQTVWDASQVPSGIYFYRLRAGSFMETRKLMLIKLMLR